MRAMTAQSAPAVPQQNNCLAPLSSRALSLLNARLVDVTLPAGAVLWDAGKVATDVFFPLTGLVSILLPLPGGEAIEVGSIGREGAAAATLGPERTEAATAGLVLIGGDFRKIAAADLFAAAAHDDDIRDMVGRCRAWLLMQAQQIAACNTVHSADKRFCRWLLACSEKLDATTIVATQEQIAALLGIRRTTLSLVAQQLGAQGLIDYRRGKIAIVDIGKLRAAACDCGTAIGHRHWPFATARAERDARRSVIV